MTENLNLAQLAQQLSPQALALTAANVGKNKAEYEKLKQAFYSAQVHLNNFAPSPIDLRSFAWQLEGKDRNWWWQLQALPFLNWYVSSYQLQSAEEQQSFLQFCLSAFECWCVNAEHNPESPLNWHDHATAFRLRNLVNWFTHCVYHQLDNGFSSDARLQSFVALLAKHLAWLADDSNYSKHTNHGFDQALVMYTVALSLPNAGIEQFLQLGKNRLITELKHAFTDEGVHKENSPGYQKFMLGRVKTLVNLDSLGDIEVSSLAKNYVEKAEAFLKALTLPNGELPMIGDTEGNIKSSKRKIEKQLEIFDYSDSGYIIIQGLCVLGKPFHLIIKNSHMSDYHRHDDDLSIHLFYDGQVLLGDAGLGFYQEKDEKRKILRSGKSHSCIYFENLKAERKHKNLKVPPSISIECYKVTAISYCYGVALTRIVIFDDIRAGVLKITDEVGINDNFNINFFSPKKFIFDDYRRKFIAEDEFFEISIDSEDEKLSPYLNNKFISSKAYAKFDTATILGWSGESSMAVKTKLKFIDYNQVLAKVSYRGLEDVKISKGQNWNFDGVIPDNFNHHIMSLRWLHKLPIDIQISIVLDFISFHQEVGRKLSRFYLGRSADHCTSVRLFSLLRVFDSNQSGNVSEIIIREIEKNIESCLSGETYKYFNNHGLMVDISLIKIFCHEKIKEKFPDSSFVLVRLNNQLKKIFCEDGFVKEHSISYQEYDANILDDLFKFFKKSGVVFEPINRLYEKSLLATKTLLGAALTKNGFYLNYGDSFSNPNRKIIKNLFGIEDPHVALKPFSDVSCVFLSKSAGVFVFRNENIHFLMTNSWNSYVHKQNDELSFLLNISSIPFFVDPGYSGLISISQFDYRSEENHSNFSVVGTEWCPRNLKKKSIENSFSDVLISADEIRVSASHGRVPGYKLTRAVSFLKGGDMFIEDTSIPANNLRHRLVLHPDVTCRVNENIIELESSGVKVRMEMTGMRNVLVETTYIIQNDALVRTSLVSILSEGYFKANITIPTYSYCDFEIKENLFSDDGSDNFFYAM